jgi:hypothetical protein
MIKNKVTIQPQIHPSTIILTYPSEIRFAPHGHEFHKAGGAGTDLSAKPHKKIGFVVKEKKAVYGKSTKGSKRKK